MHLFIKHCVTSQQELLPGLRRKLDKASLEEKSKLSCLASALRTTSIAELPGGTAELVDRTFTQKFLCGDMNLMLELQSIMHELDTSVTWRSISCLKELEKGVIQEAPNCEHMIIFTDEQNLTHI